MSGSIVQTPSIPNHQAIGLEFLGFVEFVEFTNIINTIDTTNTINTNIDFTARPV